MMRRCIALMSVGLISVGALPVIALSDDPEPIAVDQQVVDQPDDRGSSTEGGGSVAGAGYGLWYRIAGGGETFSVGGGYSLGATIGQHEAGVMSGGGYALAGGFWGGGAASDPTPTCPGDLTGNNTVGVPDLLVLLGCWGPVSPGCQHADLTGNNSVGVPDLLVLLGNWGPCP